MSRKLFGLMAMFALLIAGFVWYSKAQAAVYSSISGRVIEEDTGKGVPGMDIRIRSGDWGKETFTDQNGFYEIRDLTPGTYLLYPSSNDPSLARYYLDLGKEGMEVILPAGKNVVNQNFILKVGGSISGHVYQNDGVTPASGVGVGVVVGAFTGQGIETNPDGSFFINGIPPSNNVEVNVGVRGLYNPEVKTVQVVSGQTTTGVNFKLPPTDTGIVGTVTDADTNAPIADADVDVYDSNGVVLSVTGYTDANGIYKIFGLPPGVYTLHAIAVGYEITKTNTVSVISKQIVTFNFSMKKSQTSFNNSVIGKLKKCCWLYGIYLVRQMLRRRITFHNAQMEQHPSIQHRELLLALIIQHAQAIWIKLNLPLKPLCVR